VASNYFPHLETQKVINFRGFDVESKTEFANNSLNLPKTGKTVLGCESRAQVLLIHEKTRVRKSHVTVPL